MTRKQLTRRDFLKLAGVGTAAAIPTAFGVRLYTSALGELPLERSPYVKIDYTLSLDGSVPILLVVSQDSENRFGIYFTEILCAEGLNCFHTTEISSLQLDSLEKYEIAVLAQTELTASQEEMFTSYVANGGKIVSMRPTQNLEAVCGLERSAGGVSDGYLKTEGGHPASVGISASTLQFHGEANRYELAGAQAIAWLYTDRDTPTGYPAVAINKFEKGLAVSYAFDLAKSIAYTRQGNPQLVDQDNDGLAGVRTVDKFVGWIDLERIHIPQADEHQRLFVNVLSHLSSKPLPRLWYFPEKNKSVLITTGDSHMNPANFIGDVLTRVEARGGHMTVYYSPQIVDDIGRASRLARFWLTDYVPLVSGILGNEFGSPTPAMVENWRTHGHEIALHPYVDDALEGGWQEYWKEFTGRGYAPVPPTVRTHRVLWTGWTETARVQATYGIRMNLDYYHVGPSLQKENGEWVYGHLTGSGRPMKFIDEQGRIIDLYQQLTQIADEHLIPMDVPGWGGWPQLSAQEAVEISKYMLDCSVKDGDYCAIGGQFHVDPFQVGGDPAVKGGQFLEGTLDYAQELGVPIWSAQEWLHFSELRHDASFMDVHWNAESSSLTLRLVPGDTSDLLPLNQPESTLTVLLPWRHHDKTLSVVSLDDETTPFESHLVLGSQEYTQLIVSAKEHTIQLTYI